MDVIQLIPTHATIRPWADPVVDAKGHDPRSAYVERFWLSVIGPTATWIMRRFADEFDREPDGFTLDLHHAATSMGLSFAKGQNSPFGKALHRCVMFGLAQPTSDGFAVRRRFPTVAQRHLRRLPDDLRATHDDWARRMVRPDRLDLERRLVEAGVPAGAVARAFEAVALAS
ncbi:hypothetical protein [Ilumatobacter sp.]|uniref:hypothetical protein n=1 Tax=Ilumatobacter sp. TaxID=1967498 RepID=UPI003AF5D96C